MIASDDCKPTLISLFRVNELGKTIYFVLESPGKVSEDEFCRLVGTMVLHVVCFVIKR